MKKLRIGVLLLVLMLLWPSALAERFSADAFSFTYPDEWMDYGADDSDDVEGEYYNLGLIGGQGNTDLNVSADLYYEAEYADLRLFELDDAELNDYADMLISNYGSDTQLIEIRRIGSHQIPFIVYRGKDDYGDCIAAETMTNGYRIILSGYAYTNGNYNRARELTKADLQTFSELIDSFEPILD